MVHFEKNQWKALKNCFKIALREHMFWSRWMVMAWKHSRLERERAYKANWCIGFGAGPGG